MVFTAAEYADMHLIYGECLTVAVRAAALYAERYPNRHHPGPQVFVDLHNRMRADNCLVPMGGGGRPRNARRVQAEEAVLARVYADPTTSTRAVEWVLNVSKSTVHRIIKDEGLHPYHRTQVQKLHDGDEQLRVAFCEDLLRRHRADPDFLSSILFTDESLFTRAGCFNTHNSHHYAEENPHVTRNRGFQERWKVNMWGGIIGNTVLLYDLPDNMNVSIIILLDKFNENFVFRKKDNRINIFKSPVMISG